MEEYTVVLLNSVDLVEDRCKLGVDKGAGTFLSSEYFEGANDENLDGGGPGEGDQLGI